MKLASVLCPDRFERHVLLFVSLFHDLGKVGDGEHPYYLVNTDTWQREKQGRMYLINEDCKHAPTSERGLFILQKYGIKLSFEEWQAIRLNDGMYDETNRTYSMHEEPLALLLHWADRWAVEQDKNSPENP
jgi:hypothetical protein